MLDVEVTSFEVDADGDYAVVFALVATPDQEFYATYRPRVALLTDADTEEPVDDVRLYRALAERFRYEMEMASGD